MKKDILEQILVIDVETSGPDVFQHEMLYCAVVPMDDELPQREWFIRPENIVWGGKGKEYFSAYEGRWQEESINSREFCLQFESYISGLKKEKLWLLGHNISFDLYFLRKIFSACGFTLPRVLSHRTIDTHTLLFNEFIAGRVSEDMLSSDMAFKRFVKQDTLRHSALADAKLTKDLFLSLVG